MLRIAFFGSPRSTFTPFSGDNVLLRCIVSEQSVQFYIIYSVISEILETWRQDAFEKLDSEKIKRFPP
ncbi:MAG: hypothetical protein IJ904_05865, partial [Candidatus Methanomethylophilaceae archaeon]|nr:hypothetical protein [Candidatus Methanomethylophilaceae archaeon]